jgi:anti-anti-sigma factor
MLCDTGSMDGDFNIINHQGLLLIEVMVEKIDFFMLSDNSTRLRSILEDRQYPSMIFDFSRIKVIDSSVFGFILEVLNSVKKKGNELVIVCNDKGVLHIMKMLTISQIIRVFATRDDASDYLNSLSDV